MKRTALKAMVLILCLILTACRGTNIEPEESVAVLTWQEQYDLGVRYLSEGNYQEAVIAFTAAIEIDPKQSKAYVGLADSYIGLGDYEKALQAIGDGKSNCGEDDSFMRLESNVEFLNSGDTGIRITDFYFDKAAYLAGAETNFLVSVAYRCPEDKECILMIGANTIEPDSFRMMDQDYTVTGSGGYQFNVSLKPVQWDDADFGIYVNLSEADHGESWTPLGSDTLYIDRDGNVKGRAEPEKESQDAAVDMQNLELANFTAEYERGGHSVELNEGAVGGMNLAFDVIGPSDTCTVRIASWYEEYPSQEEIERNVARMAERWRSSWNPDGYGDKVPFSSGTSHPVDAEELGKTMYVLLIGLDRECNAVGYALVTEEIPA